jgi:hypothetical protein
VVCPFESHGLLGEVLSTELVGVDVVAAHPRAAWVTNLPAAQHQVRCFSFSFPFSAVSFIF